jgi:hypothetical protein
VLTNILDNAFSIVYTCLTSHHLLPVLTISRNRINLTQIVIIIKSNTELVKNELNELADNPRLWARQTET